MKKLFTILISVLMLAAGMTVSVDQHFCGGELAETKISISGKLASCGMEEIQEEFITHSTFSNNCCDDQLTLYSFSNNYFPEYFTFSYKTTGKDIQFLPVLQNLYSVSDIAVELASEFPPGVKLKTAPELSEICVLRI